MKTRRMLALIVTIAMLFSMMGPSMAMAEEQLLRDIVDIDVQPEGNSEAVELDDIADPDLSDPSGDGGTLDLNLDLGDLVTEQGALHTVRFDTRGGLPQPDPQTVEDGFYVQQPEDPVLEGFEFTGWFLGEEEYFVEGQPKPVYGDLTLVAGWRTVEQPAAVEEQPEVTEAQPEAVEAQPEATEEQTELGEEQPEVTEAQPEVVEAQPEVTEAQPEVVEAQPEVTEAQPEATEEQPEATEEQPEATEEQPEAVEEQPEATEEQPEAVEEQPEVTEAQPEATEEQPEAVEEQPEVTEEQPEAVEEQPEVTIEESDVIIEESEVTGEQPEATEEAQVEVEEGQPDEALDQPAEDEQASEPAEVPAEQTEVSYPAFDQYDYVGDVRVRVQAAEGVFPEGALLSVEAAPEAAVSDIDAAVESERDENRNVAASYAFDIKVVDADGNEIQPTDGEKVRVSFSMREVSNRNLTTEVYHVTEDEATGEMTAQSLDVVESGRTATAETEGFSYYQVEFTYDNNEYVLPGDETVALSEILNTVGLVGTVTAVEVSNPDLFSAYQEDGKWFVSANQPFTSTEWMKVTIGSVVYDIVVTDAIIWTVVFDSNGGSTVPNQMVSNNNKVTKPNDPVWPVENTKSFKEWQKDGSAFNFETQITSDTTLVAAWDNLIKVTFHSEYHTTDYTIYVIEDTLATPPTLTKDGYVLTEWQLNGTKFEFNSTPITEPITLNAKWEKDDWTASARTEGAVYSSDTKTISFGQGHTSGEETAVDTLNYGNSVDETIQQDYWLEFNVFAPYTVAQGDTNDIEFNINNTGWYPFSALAPEWKDNHYVVTISQQVKAADLLENLDAVNKKPIEVTYAFARKDNDHAGAQTITVNLYPQNIELLNNNVRELKIVDWKQIHTVTFEADGTVFNSVEAADGDSITAPTKNPTKAGYTFAGWKYGDAVWNIATDKVVAGMPQTITLTAAWDEAVASIGEGDNATYFATLQNAVDAAAQEGNTTVKLLEDILLTAGVDISKDVTLDLNGKTITNADDISDDYLLAVLHGGKLTVNDTTEGNAGKISMTAQYCAIKMTKANDGDANENATLIVNNGTIEGKDFAISGNGNMGRGNSVITINGGTIRSTKTSGTGDDAAIYQPNTGTVTLNGGTITGLTGVEIRSGNLVIPADSTVSVIGTGNPASSQGNGNGTTTFGAGIAIAQHTTDNPINVNIAGGTIEGANALAIVNPNGRTANNVTIAVSGGNFTGNKAVEVTDTRVSKFISGGTFNTPVDEAYCATGYIPADNGDGTYGVEPGEYVAQIGENKYKTLAEAVKATSTGTVELLKDASGAGIFVAAADNKNITIDLGGHTYTCSGPAVGSTGTESQAFHLEKGNTITIQNGKVTSTANSGVSMLVQNYSNLTLTNVTLDGGNLPGRKPYTLSNNCGNVTIGSGTTITAKDGGYAFDVCVTSYYPEGVSVTVNEGATINGTVQYDVWGSKPAENKATLTVNGGTFNGTFEVEDALVKDAETKLVINGGSFADGTGNKLNVPDDKILAKATESATMYTLVDAVWVRFDTDSGVPATIEAQKIQKGTKATKPANDPTKKNYVFGGWTLNGNAYDFSTAVNADITLTANWGDAMAKVGDVYYATLAEAVKATSTGTVELLKDASGAGIFVAAADNKNITIDLGGHTYTCSGPAVGSTGTESQAFHLEKGNTITIQNGKVTSTANSGVSMLVQNYSNLTLTNVTLDGGNLPGRKPYTLSNNCGNVTIGSGTTITAKDGGYAFDVCVTSYYPEGVSVTVNEGATINGTVQYDVWGSKPAENKATLTVNGGTFNGTFEVEDALVKDAETKLVINGGSFADGTGNKLNVPDDKILAKATESATMYTLVDAVWVRFDTDSGVPATIEAQKIQKGTTAVKPDDPTKAKYAFGGWFVEGATEAFDFDSTLTANIDLKAKWNTAVASITKDNPAVTSYYATLADAVDAAIAGDTVKLLADIEIENTQADATQGIFNIDKSITIDGDSKKITVKVTPAGSGHVFNVTEDEVAIKNLVIDGNNNCGMGIHVYGATGVMLENVEVKNCGKNGVCVNKSTVDAVNLKASGNAWGGVNVDSQDGKSEFSVRESTNGGTNIDYVYIDNREGHPAKVDITNGTFVAAFIKKPDTDPTVVDNIIMKAGQIAISGGTFSNPVPVEYCAEGFIPKTINEGSAYTVEGGANIKFINGNGSEIYNVNIATGNAVVYDTTKGTPSKTADAVGVYTWNGWSDGPHTYTKDETLPVATIEDVVYTATFTSTASVASVTTGAGEQAVTTYYPTFDAAIHAAREAIGSTLTLLEDVNSEAYYGIANSFTIDLNGKTLTAKDSGSLFLVWKGATLTINGTTKNSTVVGRINVGSNANDNGNLTLNGGSYTCSSGDTVVHVHGECKNSNVTINGATITSPDDNGIQLNGAGNHTITNSTISGKTAVYLKAGTLTVTGSTLKSTATSHTDYIFNGNGSNPTGDAIVVDSCAYPGGNPTLTLGAGNTFTVVNNSNVQIGYYEANTDKVGYESGIVNATTNELSTVPTYFWKNDGNNNYTLTKAAAYLNDIPYADVRTAVNEWVSDYAKTLKVVKGNDVVVIESENSADANDIEYKKVDSAKIVDIINDALKNGEADVQSPTKVVFKVIAELVVGTTTFNVNFYAVSYSDSAELSRRKIETYGAGKEIVADAKFQVKLPVVESLVGQTKITVIHNTDEGTLIENFPNLTVNEGYVTVENIKHFSKMVEQGESVAKIETASETRYFTSLADAIAAAQAGDTVKLLADINVANTAAKNTGIYNIDKAITIDGDGKKITVTSSTAEKGHVFNVMASGVTIKNLTVDGKGNDQHAIHVYKATGVVLENLTLTGNQLAVCVNGSSVTATDIKASGNTWGGINVDARNGKASLTVNGDKTDIKGVNNKPWAAVYVDSDATNASTVTINAGNVEGVGENPDSVPVNAGDSIKAYVNTIALPENYAWEKQVDDTYKAVAAEASVTAAGVTTNYATLQEALTAANAGDTVKLLADINVANTAAKNTGIYNIDKAITIDGAGKTITITSGTAETGHVFNVAADNVTIKNLTVNGAGKDQHAIHVYKAENVTLSDLTLNNNTLAICVNGSKVTATNIKASGNTWGGINVDARNGEASLTVDGAATDIKGVDGKPWAAVYVDSDATNPATVTINGGKVDGVGENPASASVNAGDSIKAYVNNIALPANYAWKQIDTNEYEAVAAVASITKTVEGTAVTSYYATLADAVNAAVANDTIVMIADSTEGAFEIKKNVTINLNGKTVTETNVITVSSGAQVEIKDGTENANGKIEFTWEQDAEPWAALYVKEDGTKLTLTSGTFSSATNTVLRVGSGAEGVIDGATLTGTDNGSVTAYASAGGTLTMNSGSVSATTNSALTTESGTLVINQDPGKTTTITSDGGYAVAAYRNGANITINGGTINGALGGVRPYYSATAIINGGTITSAKDAVYVGGTAASSTGHAGTVTITGGTINGTDHAVYVYGGMATINDSSALAIEGAVAHAEGGTVEAKHGGNTKYKEYVTKENVESGYLCTTNAGTDGYFHIVKAIEFTFDANGGMMEDGKGTLVRLVPEGEKVENSEGRMPNNPTKKGSAFDGWYTGTDFATKFDFNTPITSGSINRVYAKWGEPVAQIGETTYPTLESAFEAAKTEGDTITLIADIELPRMLTNEKNVTLNLNGYTIEEAGSRYIRNEGTLTLTDSSADKEGGIVGTTYGIFNAGKLNIVSGNIAASKYGVSQNEAEAVTNITGGIITAQTAVNAKAGTVSATTKKNSHEPYILGTKSDVQLGTAAKTLAGGSYTRKVPEGYIVAGKTCTTKPNDEGYYEIVDEITVTFKDGDMVKAKVEVPKGETIEESEIPADPEKTGYTFDGWFSGDNKFDPAGKVEATVTYTAKWNVNEYKIEYVLNGGTATDNRTNYTAETTPITLTLNNPTKTGYTFLGWTSNEATDEIKKAVDNTTTTVTISTNALGDRTYTATWTPIKYTITFVDEDGAKLSTAEYDYGTEAEQIVTPDEPTKAGDAQYTYTFAGWTPEIAAVTGDATYKATYTETTKEYTVKFVNEGYNPAKPDESLVLQSGEVAYGETPEYTGEEPTKAAEGTKTYAFKEWSPKIVAVTGEATYTATYEETENVAKIGDTYYTSLADAVAAAKAGESIVLLKDIETDHPISIDKKITLDLAGKTINYVPEEGTTKATYVQYITVQSAGDLTITGDGTITGPDNGASFDGKALISVDGGKLTFENGTLTATGEGSDGMYGVYVLNGGTAIFENPTITSHFAAIGTNNTTAPATIIVNGGTYTANAKPTNNEWWSYFCAPIYAASNGSYDIKGGTFNGYYGISSRYADVDQTITLGDVTMNASSDTQVFVDEKAGSTHTPNKTVQSTVDTKTVPEGYKWIETAGKYVLTKVYTIKFVNDGYDPAHPEAALVLQESEVAAGVTPAYDFNKGIPTKAANGNTYTFAGWTPAIVAVTEDATYTATYTEEPNTFTMKFVDEEGNLYDVITAKYNTEITAPEVTKTGYAFDKWVCTTEGEGETTVPTKMPAKNLTFKATWETNTYKVTFYDEDGTTVIKVDSADAQNYREYAYGTAAESIAKPSDPTKAGDAQYTYTFAGWTPEIAAVTGDATYKATYTETTKEYTVKFVNEGYNPAKPDESLVLQSGEVAYGETPEYTGEEPTKAGDAQHSYTFAGWTPEIAAVTGDATYKATYTETTKEYTVKFVNEGYNPAKPDESLVLQSGEVAYGETPEYTGEEPTKAAEGTKTYAFKEWSPKIVAVTGEATYTATYEETENVARIGETYYESLEEAFKAADYDIIDLLVDTKIDSITVDTDVTLNLNGHEVSSDAPNLFYVTKEGDLTIHGRNENGIGKITGPKNGEDFDGKALITVDGGHLYINGGELTATGEGSDGMYGVYVLKGGMAIFREPTITSHFAAIGTNNTTAPATIIVNGGTYTANAKPTNNEWWSYFCAPIYAASNGSYDIKGGTFNGYYGISSRYADVDQTITLGDVTMNGSSGTDVFVDEKIGSTHTPNKTVQSTVNTKRVPEGYTWVEEGDVYRLVKLFTVTFKSEGEEFATQTIPEGETVDAPEDEPTTEQPKAFGGWSTDGKTLFDFNTKLYEDTTIDAMWLEPVASVVTSGDKTTYFLSLAEAVDAAKGGDTIKMLADDTLYGDIVIDKAVSIDFNGFTVNEGTSSIVNNDTLNLMDTSDGDEAGGLVGSNYCIDNNGTLKISGGELYGTKYGIYQANGEAVTYMDGGVLSSNKSAIYAKAGMVYIESDATIIGSMKDVTATSTAKVEVSGGWFSKKVPANQCAKDYKPTEAREDAPNAAAPYTVEGIDYEAQIGQTKYETFADAAAAAEEGDVIKLLKDAEEPYTMTDGDTLKVEKGENAIEITAPAGKVVKESIEEGITTYTLADAEASITKGDPAVTTDYETFAEAAQAAGDGDVIKLLKDVEEPYELAEDETLRVEKDGKKVEITAPAGKAVSESTTGDVTTYTLVDAEASITKGEPEETTYYATFTEAALEAEDDDVVKLLKDAEEPYQMSDGEILKVEKDDHDVTVNGAVATSESGDPVVTTYYSSFADAADSAGGLIDPITLVADNPVPYQLGADETLYVKAGDFEPNIVAPEGKAVKAVTDEETGITSYTLEDAVYTITYELNGGENDAENPTSYSAGMTADLELKDATREYYNFAGWYSDKALTTKVEKIAVGSTGNITLYAKWEDTVTFIPTLNLADYTGINVYIHIPEGENPDDYTVKVSAAKSIFPEAEKNVFLSMLETDNRDRGDEKVLCYKIEAIRAASPEMTDVATVKLFKGDQEVKSEAFSVRNIAEARLNSGTLLEKQVPIHKALLQYGHYAQIQFKSGESDMDVPEGAPEMVKIPDSFAPKADPTGLNGYITAFDARANLSSAISMNVYLTPADGYTINDFEISVTDKDGNAYSNYTAPEMSGNRIQITIQGMWSPQIGRDFNITVKLKEDASKTATWTRSVMTCAYVTQQTNTNPATQNLVKALCAYYNAAAALWPSLK